MAKIVERAYKYRFHPPPHAASRSRGSANSARPGITGSRSPHGPASVDDSVSPCVAHALLRGDRALFGGYPPVNP